MKDNSFLALPIPVRMSKLFISMLFYARIAWIGMILYQSVHNQWICPCYFMRDLSHP